MAPSYSNRLYDHYIPIIYFGAIVAPNKMLMFKSTVSRLVLYSENLHREWGIFTSCSQMTRTRPCARELLLAMICY
jgi:hypothetical protein